MRILEFGSPEKKKIILLHGLNIPWQMWQPVINCYAAAYHVLVPVLDGHDPKTNAPFISIEDEAEQIKAYYLPRYGTAVHMVIGLSMGGAIGFSLLSSGELETEYLVLDSGVFVPTPKPLLVINNKLQLGYKNKTKARKPKTLKQLEAAYGSALAPYYIEMADKIGDEGILAAANAIGSFSLADKISFPNTKIIAF
ncbi:MAG: alpha/beta hydrolase, partial [Bacillota bacterium]|nr:alpha/beta hydrolase [Bacillota bacterium]